MAERYRLILADEEKGYLRGIINKKKASAKRVVRGQVLLAVAENGLNKDDSEVSQLYGLSTKSIERLRKRCCEEGLQVALEGKKREVFKEKKLTGEVEAKLAMLACSEPPEERDSWTLQLLADKMVELNYIDSISHTSVGTLLKKMSLSPGERRCG
ncbi:helix-turn-helix domain-containing protein [Pontibacter pamirensis]|uniref:helix-turn-helix domain-containing protein n=1 Tax=Pontibacter pamirensis TaxID=2562824 RepID=UPI00138A3450|nr:helix-turn-helix domain-containing protein [Pontibacter pamirensis]